MGRDLRSKGTALLDADEAPSWVEKHRQRRATLAEAVAFLAARGNPALARRLAEAFDVEGAAGALS